MTFTEFKNKIDEWHESTKFMSSHGQMANHSVLEELKTYEDKETLIGYACLLLEEQIHLMMILLFNVVPGNELPPHPGEYYGGRIPVMRECWKYWALKENKVTKHHDEELYWVEDKFGNKGAWS